MIDFSTLRANRGKQGEALKRSMEKTSGGGYKADPRIWKYTRDEKKNISSNIIRFLPIAKADFMSVQEGNFKEEDLTPVIHVLALRFEGKNGWFVGNTRATFGEPCPVREWTGPKWKAIKGANKEDPQVKAEREYLKKFIPKTEYYANILVINDAQVPENNGKVFIFQFGEAIRKILNLAENPQFPNQPKIDPYDPWNEGANLLLDLTYEQRKFNGKEHWVPKFDTVRWGPQEAMGDDAFIDSVWAQQHSLLGFHADDKFLTYEASKQKLMKVMSLDENLNPVVGGTSSVGRSVADYGTAQTVAAPAAPAPAPVQEDVTQTAHVAAPAVQQTQVQPAATVPADDPIMARLRGIVSGQKG